MALGLWERETVNQRVARNRLIIKQDRKIITLERRVRHLEEKLSKYEQGKAMVNKGFENLRLLINQTM